MFDVTEADVRPLDAFPLKWRWLEDRPDRLGPDVLAHIHPLTEGRARKAYIHAEAFQGAALDEHYAIIDEYEIDARFEAQADAETRAWLRKHLGKESDPLCISYSQPWALRTDAPTFITHWHTFLYPVEDVVIWPHHEGWVLLFDYKQRFLFARRTGAGSPG